MKGISIGLLLCLGVSVGWTQGTQGGGHKNAGNFEVEIIPGLAYRDDKDADPVRHKLDLILPKGHKDFPMLLFVHGGAWKSGSKELYAPLGRTLARNGIGTVIINYRLSPKVQHPAHIEDVAKAFAWTHKNIAKHGGDPNNIFICGHSAGGHLVALLGANDKYLKAENLEIKNIKGMIPMSGVYIIEPIDMLSDVFTKKEEVVKSASPIEFVAAGRHPPCLMMYADSELANLGEQAELMFKKMSECKCDVRLLKIDKRTHVSIIFNMISESDPTTQAVFEFLAKHGGLKLKDAGK